MTKEERLRKQIERLAEMKQTEAELHRQGYQYIAGVDEVGRGPLAGPVVTAAVVLAGLAAQTVFALGWETDARGRRYVQQDYTYVANGWKWIDGSCYYFDANGYVVTNGVTPDNYTVDQAGIWTVDGVRQKNKRLSESS